MATTRQAETASGTTPALPILQFGERAPRLQAFRDRDSAAQAAAGSPSHRFVDARARLLAVREVGGAPVLRVSSTRMRHRDVRARVITALKQEGRKADQQTLAECGFQTRRQFDSYVRWLRARPTVPRLIVKLCKDLDPDRTPRRRLCKMFRTC